MPRSDGEPLEVAYRRSARLTRRRRILGGAGAAGLVVVVLVALAAPPSREDPDNVRTVDAPRITTLPVSPALGAPVRTGTGGRRASDARRGAGAAEAASASTSTVVPERTRPTPATRGRVAFVDMVPGSDSASLVTVNADGSDPRVLATVVPTGFGVSMVRWSPDGTRLAYLDGSGAGLTVINQDGSGRTPLTAAGLYIFGFDWSPDGQELAYTTARPRGAFVTYSLPGVSFDGDVGIISADGLMQRPVTADTSSDSFPQWSPDGSEIQFVRYGANGARDGLFSVAPNGLGLRLIREGSFDLFARSSDGAGFAATALDVSSGFVETFDANGSNARRILSPYVGAFRDVPSWSPDSTEVALADGDGQLLVVASDGSSTRVVAQGVIGGAAWLPEADTLFFGTRSGVSRVSRDGSEASAVMAANACLDLDVWAR